MSALTPTEQALFNLAKESLPKLLFADGEDDFTPELAAFAKQFAPAFNLLSVYEQDTFIAVAATEALNQHAKDRGTRRQENESNEALALRLRFMREDAITVAAMIARATDILTSFGITILTGYPAITELRKDRLHYGYSGSIQLDAIQKSLITDGETYVVDGVTYEFDKTGDGVAAGNVLVDIVSIPNTADDTAVAMLAAMSARFGSHITHPASGYLLITDWPGEASDAVTNVGFRCFRQKGCYNRGLRYTGAARQGTVFVMMLPYGTTAEAAASVAEALRQIKAGGIKVITERRLSP